jgi:SAM-dependent methyltransferase
LNDESRSATREVAARPRADFREEPLPTGDEHECPLCGPHAAAQGRYRRIDEITGEAFSVVACGSCGHGVTSPFAFRPDAYPPSGYAPWGGGGTLRRAAFAVLRALNARWKLRRIRRAVPALRRLLDVGAGDGAFANFVQDRGYEVAATEPSATARRAASNRGVAAVERLEELGGRRFDAVTAWHVVEHVPDPVALLSAMRETVAPGGAAFVAVPNFASRDLARYGSDWAPLDPPRHLHHFTPDSLKRALASSGWTDVEIVAMPFDALFSVWESEASRPAGRSWRSIGANLVGSVGTQLRRPLRAASILAVARASS